MELNIRTFGYGQSYGYDKTTIEIYLGWFWVIVPQLLVQLTYCTNTNNFGVINGKISILELINYFSMSGDSKRKKNKKW